MSSNTLFGQFNDRPVTLYSNMRHLEHFADAIIDSKRVDSIKAALLPIKQHWKKIRFYKISDLPPFKIPQNLKRKHLYCLFIVINGNAQSQFIRALHKNSDYFDVEFNPDKTKWAKMICFFENE